MSIVSIEAYFNITGEMHAVWQQYNDTYRLPDSVLKLVSIKSSYDSRAEIRLPDRLPCMNDILVGTSTFYYDISYKLFSSFLFFDGLHHIFSFL